MLLRTFVLHRLSGRFLRWTEKTLTRGEALGGTGPFFGCTQGVYGGVHRSGFRSLVENRLISGFLYPGNKRLSLCESENRLISRFLNLRNKAASEGSYEKTALFLWYKAGEVRRFSLFE